MTPSNRRRPPPRRKPCPECGEPLAVGNTYCRECGFDAAAAAADDAATGGFGEVELPEGYGGENEFDYDEFLESEGLVSPVRRRGKRLLWTIVAIVALAAFLSAILF